MFKVLFLIALLAVSARADVATARLGSLGRNDIVVTNVTGIGSARVAEMLAVDGTFQDVTGCVWRVEHVWRGRDGVYTWSAADDAWVSDSGQMIAYRPPVWEVPWYYYLQAVLPLGSGADATRLVVFDGEFESEIVRSAVTNLVYAPASAASVAAVAAIVAGDDVQFVVTNYNSVTHMPSASVRYRDPDGVWRLVWDELTRWDWLTGTFLPDRYMTRAETAAALDEKADRAWGHYDSATGLYAPDGVTWISSPQVVIAGGLAYQRTVTSGGAIWVLCSNGLVSQTGGTTNGFFRISDDEGNAVFEIVKGDKQIVGANAGSLTTSNEGGVTVMTIGYPVTSDAHPTISVTRDLLSPDWQPETAAECPAAVAWSGTSGAWTATVTPRGPYASLFVRASYEAGSETVIRQSAPISPAGGILCTDGVHKVRPVYNNGAVTWEVF